MNDLPAEGDFDDFAAAVGEGGDGSDDDATVRHETWRRNSWGVFEFVYDAPHPLYPGHWRTLQPPFAFYFLRDFDKSPMQQRSSNSSVWTAVDV